MQAPHDHQIQLTTLYGDVVESEHVPESELAPALRRFHRRAVARANSLVVMDGIVQTRNAFLEFMREFNETAARTQPKARAAH